jgi:hypothetical protein
VLNGIKLTLNENEIVFSLNNENNEIIEETISKIK